MGRILLSTILICGSEKDAPNVFDPESQIFDDSCIQRKDVTVSCFARVFSRHCSCR